MGGRGRGGSSIVRTKVSQTTKQLSFDTQEKSFLNLAKSTGNQIVLTIFQLIWIQTDFRLDPNQSENGKYNLISG